MRLIKHKTYHDEKSHHTYYDNRRRVFSIGSTQ